MLYNGNGLKLMFKLRKRAKSLHKCSKISNTFRFLFSNNMVVIRAGTHNMLVRKANGKDPDQLLQKQSDLGMSCLLRLLRQAPTVRNFRTFTV